MKNVKYLVASLGLAIGIGASLSAYASSCTDVCEARYQQCTENFGANSPRCATAYNFCVKTRCGL